jgi:hypothetical protein
MIDRQKVEAILVRRFPGSAHREVAAAANAIMGLPEEWEEATPCGQGCQLVRDAEEGIEFRIFRRRTEH